MRNDIEKVLFTEEAIANRVGELGALISEEYAGKEPVLVCILKGSVIFTADLMRSINIPCTCDFIAASSYGDSATSSGNVRIRKDLDSDIEGRHVIIVEDILDSGVTLAHIKGLLSSRKPASLKICTLLEKRTGKKAPVTADYVGFECPNAFVVGYGLDFAEKYRNLPYIGSLKREIYA